jgi:hypothetical protein
MERHLRDRHGVDITIRWDGVTYLDVRLLLRSAHAPSELKVAAHVSESVAFCHDR